MSHMDVSLKKKTNAQTLYREKVNWSYVGMLIKS